MTLAPVSTEIKVRCQNPFCAKALRGGVRQQVTALVLPAGITITTINQCRICKHIQAVEVTG